MLTKKKNKTANIFEKISNPLITNCGYINTHPNIAANNKIIVVGSGTADVAVKTKLFAFHWEVKAIPSVANAGS